MNIYSSIQNSKEDKKEEVYTELAYKKIARRRSMEQGGVVGKFYTLISQKLVARLSRNSKIVNN